jgi:hypothetical protein
MQGGNVKHSFVKTAGAVIALFVFLTPGCKKPPVNAPPETPATPSGNSTGNINVSYAFTSSATDPDEDSIAVRFDWGNNVQSDWSPLVTSGDTVSISYSWSSPDTYTVKAQATDKHNTTSDWSAPHTIAIIRNLPPNAPATPSGPSSARKDSLCIFTAITTDPDGDGLGYRFAWGNGDTSEWTGWVPNGWPGGQGYAYRRAGIYTVRAQARDANEALSAWSNPLQMSVPNPNPPNTPSTPSGPSSGKPNADYNFSSSATDPDGDSVTIRFSWGDGDTSAWSTLVASGATVTMSHSWRSLGTYQVKAQARDEDGALSSWSSGRQIAIVNFPPNTPSIPSGPSSGHPNVSFSFSSSASDPDGDSVVVRFSWGAGDTSNWSSFVPSGQTVTMSHSWRDTGTYYVKAQAKDKYGAVSSWSTGRQIDIGTIPPNTPSTPSGPSSGNPNATYNFSSSATDPDGDSVALRFAWGDGDTSLWSSWVPSGSLVSMSHSWSSPGSYDVKAQAKGVYGATSNWSSGHQIVIEMLWQLATSTAGWSARSSHTSVVFDNKIWVLGGFTYPSLYHNDVWYSSDGVNWTQATANAGWSARCGHTSVVFDNRIWVLGAGGHSDVWYSSDGVNWTQATANAGWSARSGHTSVVFDNRIWVLGGSLHNDVWYSTDGVNWTQATANAGWSARGGHTSVVFDNKIWVLSDYYHSRNDVWYSSDGVNWTQATANAGWSARGGHTSVVFDNKIWVLGGSDFGGSRNDVWYSSGGVNWTRATANAGWSIRSSHSSVVFDNKIWVLGGNAGDCYNDAWYWP